MRPLIHNSKCFSNFEESHMPHIPIFPIIITILPHFIVYRFLKIESFSHKHGSMKQIS